MENSSYVGLKFHRFRDNQILVDYEGAEVNSLNDPDNNDHLMLYNFRQLERFCHRIGKKKDMKTMDESIYKHYVVAKDFSKKTKNDPVMQAEIYNIYHEVNPNLNFSYTIYRNGKNYVHKGFVSVDIENPFLNPSISKIYEKAVCTISIVDYEGNDRFTQYEIFYEEEYENAKSFSRFISRDTVLCNPLELLHCDDILFHINLQFLESSNADIEDIMPYSFEESPQGEEILLLDSVIGREFCQNYGFFSPMLHSPWVENETRRMRISVGDAEDLKNIYRFLKRGNYIKVTSYENIYSLYRSADFYGFPSVVIFCRELFRKNICLRNIKLINNLAEAYNDVELKEIFESFQIQYQVPGEYICNKQSEHFLGEENELDYLKAQHIHNAYSEYLQCDSFSELDLQYYLFDTNYEERDKEIDFHSIFIPHRDEVLILSLESDFGRILRTESIVIKDMLRFGSFEVENNEIEIRQKNFEAFKNVYRILMGLNYIKASTIGDIISLYEVADFYDIPQVMKVCKYLFNSHMCVQNAEAVRNLARKCFGDDELDVIVKIFQANYNELDDMTKQETNSWAYTSDDLDDKYDFYQ